MGPGLPLGSPASTGTRNQPRGPSGRRSSSPHHCGITPAPHLRDNSGDPPHHLRDSGGADTSKFEEFEKLHEQWLAATEGKRTVVSERICRDRDQPDIYVVIVEFPSYEEALKNNDLPATGTIAASMAALADEPPTFRNLDLIRTD